MGLQRAGLRTNQRCRRSWGHGFVSANGIGSAASAFMSPGMATWHAGRRAPHQGSLALDQGQSCGDETLQRVQEFRRRNARRDEQVNSKVVMFKRIFAEALLVAVGTLFFLALAATVGIPTKDRNPVRAVTTVPQQPPAPAWAAEPSWPVERHYEVMGIRER